jgi:hypothetical protein
LVLNLLAIHILLVALLLWVNQALVRVVVDTLVMAVVMVELAVAFACLAADQLVVAVLAGTQALVAMVVIQPVLEIQDQVVAVAVA